MQDAKKILHDMLLIRRVEEEIIKRYPQQQMRCPVHLSIGQEAIAVGACHHLTKEDKVFSTHRCHAHYLAKGGDLNKMVLELYGKIGGCLDGRGGSMSLMDNSVGMVMSGPIVGSAIPLAVGAALANKIDGNKNIVMVFFGDGAVEEGVFYESINFAELMQLPIIFVCENNQYSVDTHISKRQAPFFLDNLHKTYPVSVHMEDKDVYDIAEKLKDFIAIARNNSPLLIVIDTQRSHVHCGIEVENILENDPMQMAFLNSRLSLQESCEIDTFARLQTVLAFDAAESAPLPTPDMAKEYVYA